MVEIKVTDFQDTYRKAIVNHVDIYDLKLFETSCNSLSWWRRDWIIPSRRQPKYDLPRSFLECIFRHSRRPKFIVTSICLLSSKQLISNNKYLCNHFNKKNLFGNVIVSCFFSFFSFL